MNNYNPLSPREKEVLQLTSQGLTCKEIAAQLHLSNHTIISHRKNMMEKMKALNVAHLVRRSFENGIISAVKNN